MGWEIHVVGVKKKGEGSVHGQVWVMTSWYGLVGGGMVRMWVVGTSGVEGVPAVGP